MGTRPSDDRPSHRDRADVAALADGSLPPERRAEVEARVASSPALAGLLERQRLALRAVRGAAGPAPAGLRARIEAARPGAARVRRGRGRLAAGLAAAVLASALVLELVLPGGAPESPSVSEAAALAARPASAPAPGRYDEAPLLTREVEGVRFPRWQERFGWRATGARVDRLDGRRAVTVFYTRGGRRVAYTIVSGRALPVPRRADPTTRAGTELATLTGGGRTVVTWRRRGRTCVLSGDRVAPDTLLALASWRGAGRVAY
jgi:hypothetical protein